MKSGSVLATLAIVGLVGREAAAYREREARRAANRAVRSEAAAGVGATRAPAGPHLAIVMAAYEEADGLTDVLAKIPPEIIGLPVRIVVVDDGSTDRTAAIASDSGADVAVHGRNLGQGDALHTGFAVALDGGAEVVVTMDAGGQHRADQIEELVAPVVAGDADYVQGSRFLGLYDDAGTSRDAGIRVFTALINAVGGTDITDCTNGFRAIRGEGLARMRLHEDRFSAPEIILEARRRGLRMLEVPVHIQSREHGESKKPRRLGYPLGFARAIAEVRLRHALGR